MKRLLFVVVLLATNATVKAETVEEMLSACRPMTTLPVEEGKIDLPPSFPAGLCWGAFASLQVLYKTVWAGESVPFLKICLPPESTRSQLIAVFVKYADEHPERYHEEFFWVAHNALIASFPCKN